MIIRPYVLAAGDGRVSSVPRRTTIVRGRNTGYVNEIAALRSQ